MKISVNREGTLPPSQGTTARAKRVKSTRSWCKALGALALGMQMSFGAFADVAPLSTQGNQVLAGGQPASFAGNSLFWSNNGWGGEKYYTPGTVAWLKSDWQSTLVRAAMGVQDPGGYLDDPQGNKAKVKTVVDAAIANDLYVIIDWHSHHAENNTAEAVAFFQEMASTYGQHNHVIYEIYNEPLSVSWSGVIKPYAQQVISAIRAIDPDNLIIVGTPTWSQDVDAAANDPITGYNNIAYTLHFYAGTHGQSLRNKAQTALDKGIPLFVTEWGTVNADGNGGVNYGETQAWVDFMKSRNISHANWSINDKAEGASALVAGASGTGGWSSGQLTASGNLVRDIIKDWPRTTPPQPCTAVTLPAKVEAEAYCSMQGIQTEATTDVGGGLNVGWTDSGDSLTYKVDVPTAGDYTIRYRVASEAGGGAFQLGASPALSVANTGGWQSWTTLTQTVSLAAGVQDLTLSVTSGGFNLNWIEFSQGDTPPPTGAVKPLSVSGNQILAGGQPASFAGNSLFWSNNGWGDAFYNSDVINWLKSDWDSQLVRAAMGVEDGGGYLEDPASNKARVKTVVEAAIANDMYVIIDWHSHHAEQYTSESIAFFQEMASTYGQYPNVIYEIYNEPLNTTSWSGTIKPYAEQVISAIRAIDPDNLIVVGTRTWSQRVDEAAADPIAGPNIAYGLHFYVGTHGQFLRDIAQSALDQGAALFVTEWGFWGADNSCCDFGEADAWQTFMKNNGISSAGWSIIDKVEPSSHLMPGASTQGGWSDNQLTPAGLYVKNMVKNWQDNETCTIGTVNSTLQAEAYCAMAGVQTEATTDIGGGQNLGYLDAGDWASYDLNVPTAGNYTFTVRVASENGGGRLSLESNGNYLGHLDIPNTGGWQVWTTATLQVNLPAGRQNLKLLVDAGGFNINWFQLNNGNPPVSFDQTLQAEDYSYMQGIQTESTTDTGGGLNVGWTDAGDWLSYVNTPVNIPETGTYTVEFRVASNTNGASISFEEAGGTATYGVVAVPNTGGWQSWQTVSITVELTAGSHGFGLGTSTGGWNLNWFRIYRQ